MNQEILCLAQVIYHEARGEPAVGQELVALVAKNRKEHPEYPDSYCGVKDQPKAFENINSTRDWSRTIIPESIELIAKRVYEGKVLAPKGLRCQLLFFATKKQPYMGEVIRVNRHIFGCAKKV